MYKEFFGPMSAPRYFYSTPNEAFSILNEVGRENIRYQCDFYHLQIEHGNLAKFVSQNIEKIEHVQVAQVRKLKKVLHIGGYPIT